MDLKEEDIEACQNAFKDLDEEGQGSIKASDLKIALERINVVLGENDLFKMISELDDNHTGQIKFSDFLTIYCKYKNANSEDDDSDTLDAFVAMGGQADKEGSVDANQLINIIKNEFEMTIDIENLINEIDKDKSGKIEYDEFKTLLKSNYGNESN
jgi:centrin-2